MNKPLKHVYTELLRTCPDYFFLKEELKTREDIKAWKTNELSYLGIGKGEWKMLEREGKALRARAPTKRGHETRWVLLRGEK